MLTGQAEAPAPAEGASLLTTGIPAAPPPVPKDGADLAVEGVLNGPPEWAPAKFWDAEKKSLKTEDLGKAYLNLEKLIGREKVPVPTGDDDEEGWNRWYAATGRPEKEDEYEFERPTELPKGLNYDEDTEKAFKTWAHANGLNKKQAKNLYDGYVKTQIERHSAWYTNQQQSRSKVEQDLRREYGQQYEQALTQAKTALGRYGDPDFLKWLDETGQGNDPRMIRAWMRIGKEMNGETRIKGSAAQEANPADLDKSIADFRAQHQKALFDREHPDHGRRVTEYNKLFQARFGDQ